MGAECVPSMRGKLHNMCKIPIVPTKAVLAVALTATAAAVVLATSATTANAQTGTASKPAPATSAKRPNILFVLIDDMGYGDLSCYGGPPKATPAIDRLASEGVRFTQFTVAAPICSASRTGLTTGQYPARWGITSFLASRAENEKRGMKQWLDPKAPTLARTLHDAGYATGHFGKWHMGGQRDVGDAPLITDYGFDASLTQFEGLGDRVLAMLDDRDGKPARKMPLGVGSEKLGRGKITWTDRAQVTTAFVDRAIAFMKDARKTGKPFFVNVWPDDVHSPFFPSSAGRGNGTKRALYKGVVHETDTQLAPLFEFIRNDPALRDNTLVVLASDNGPEPGAGTAGPFRGHKGNLYEGGIREPLIAWGPGIVKTPAVNDTTVISGVDMLPSLLSVAGVGAKTTATKDGEDLSAALLGKNQATRTKPLFWLRPPDRPGPDADPQTRWPDLAVRDGNWKLLVMEDGSNPQLYDLKTDIAEKTNIADAHKEIVERLTKLALAWRKTLPVAPLPKAALPGSPPANTTSE